MIAILHNIRSLHNVGSIFRTADAAGLEKIYLCGYTPAPVDEMGRTRAPLAKVALGAEKTIPWEKISSITKTIAKLKKEGFIIAAVEQDQKSIPFYKTKFTPKMLNKIALVMGEEVAGLPTSILKICDLVLEIPMHGKKESLNVSVAFGIVVFNLIYR